MLNQSRQQSRRRAIHENSQSEMFLKIGALKRNAKSLKNTSEQIHSLVESYKLKEIIQVKNKTHLCQQLVSCLFL